MAEKKLPQRRCVGCGVSRDKKELIRVIHTPEDLIILDPTGRQNGRGAYLCKSPDCLKKARKTKGLERSLKVAIPEAVYEELEKEMSRLAE